MKERISKVLNIKVKEKCPTGRELKMGKTG
jgi:hypothetical protein